MTKDEKIQIVQECIGLFSRPGVYLMDFRGLNVAEITNLRVKLRESNVTMKVVKNTLAKRALKEVGIETLDSYFVGPTGVVSSESDSITPVRLLLDFIKQTNKGTVKAGLVDGSFISEKQIEAVSKLPTKRELQAKLASALNAPIVKLARTLNAMPSNFVRTVDALREMKTGESS